MSEAWAAILDDPERLGAADAGDMLGHLDAFGSRLAQSWTAPVPLPDGREAPRRVLVGAMGGSAIAAEILGGFLAERGEARILARRAYAWPALGEGDFLVVCSHSGETEESLALYAAARGTGLPLVALSNGGRLAELAAADGVPHLSLAASGRRPPPRAALPQMLGRLLALCSRWGGPYAVDADPDALRADLVALGADCGIAQPLAGNPAKRLALALGDRRPVFTALTPDYEALASRLRSQFEENAKRFALCRSLPELHHNSWIPWMEGDPPGLPVWLGGADAAPRVRLRRRLSEEALSPLGLIPLELGSRGDSALGRVLTSSLLGDYLVVYHALMRGVDPSPTPSLDAMKRRLRDSKER